MTNEPTKWAAYYDIGVDGYKVMPITKLHPSLHPITEEQAQKVQSNSPPWVPCGALRDKFPTTRDEEANLGAYIDAYFNIGSSNG